MAHWVGAPETVEEPEISLIRVFWFPSKLHLLQLLNSGKELKVHFNVASSPMQALNLGRKTYYD
jgi:hypothetical protein